MAARNNLTPSSSVYPPTTLTLTTDGSRTWTTSLVETSSSLLSVTRTETFLPCTACSTTWTSPTSIRKVSPSPSGPSSSVSLHPMMSYLVQRYRENVADNLVDPSKKIRLTLAYPASTGRVRSSCFNHMNRTDGLELPRALASYRQSPAR